MLAEGREVRSTADAASGADAGSEATPQRLANPRFIGRQLAAAFASVSLVAIATSAMLVYVIQDVSGLVDSMRHDESAIRQGMDLSTAVRERSLSVAQLGAAGSAADPARYRAWQDRVREGTASLESRVPAGERGRLAQLRSTSERIDGLVTGALLPAAARGDATEVRRVLAAVGSLGDEAARHADVLATVTTEQMAHAHDHATRSTRLGLLGGGVGALLIVLLSVAFTSRLRSVLLEPLGRLTAAALRYGRGDFGFRVGNVGQGELAAVGDALTRMADELARREARLLQNERMAVIGQLAAGVAHELNNPIGIIRGYLKTMRPDEEPETLREELAILDEEAGHCQRITGDLLSYARAEPLSMAPLAMAPFLEETATRYGVGADTPAEVEAEQGTLDADGARLRQVVLNLLLNAGQASPAGEAIRLEGSRAGDAYRIDVLDRGPGVDAADAERVFEPFYSKRRGGSGLGLAVCQGIVKAHGGTIEVLPRPGGGACFRVELPAEPASVPTAPVAASASEAASTSEARP
ncbi:MAG: HAMP domain-containing sensor histidine kinase [Myxococcota bacterium]